MRRWPATWRLLSIVVLLGALSGCGGSTTREPRRSAASGSIRRERPRGLVAIVDRHRVGAADLERLTRVETVLFSSAYKGGAPLPQGWIPDPPNYGACVAYLGKRQPSRSRTQLERMCVDELNSHEQEALSKIVLAYWVRDEAAQRHIGVTNATIRAEAAKLGIAPPAQLRKTDGIELSDLRLFLGTTFLLQKLYERLPIWRVLRRRHHESMQLAEEIDAEDSAFASAMTKRLSRRTFCLHGLTAPGCSSQSSSDTK